MYLYCTFTVKYYNYYFPFDFKGTFKRFSTRYYFNIVFTKK